jgi:hypothetical protein
MAARKNRKPKARTRLAGKPRRKSKVAAAAQPNEVPNGALGVPGPDVAKLEADLIRKYPQARIVSNSYRLAGDPEGFLGKRSVVIECAICGKKRRIATSDVFQTLTCSPECKREFQKLARESKDAASHQT